MKKSILMLLTLFISINITAQEEVNIGSKYGIDISYQILKTKKTKKKDVYLLIATAVNTNDYDVYYKTPISSYSTIYDSGFTQIKVRNATGIFRTGQAIYGSKLTLRTTKGQLSILEAGETYNFETNFRVKKGDTPLITNTFNSQLFKFETFEILLGPGIVSGEWSTTCGTLSMTLDYTSKKHNVNGVEETYEVISQSTNGKQFIWMKVAENSFVREDIEGYNLSYNSSTGLFLYSTSDGLSCNWSKN